MSWPEDCKHPHTELRLWTITGGAKQAKQQCLDCGARLGQPEKINDRDIPPADMELYELLQQRLMDLLRRRSAELRRPEVIPEDRKAEYHAYLQSEHWHIHRQRVIERDGGVCQSCLKARATDVHHLTYAYGFRAPAFALVAVCRPCHEWLHALAKEKEEE